jgi:aryl-alcohol dehydrogenase-like predicted oxidoreductase
MRERPLGSSGLTVSEVGFGAWGIGGTMWLGADDDESLRALARAIELGVTFIDTALGYGDGHSEKLVGRAVREAGGSVAVASKIPPKNRVWPAPAGISPQEAFPAEWVIECTERSLRNLGLDTIDVQQFHVWSDDWTHDGDWLDGVEQLKRDGKIRLFGVSINDHQPANALRLIESGQVDTVQVIYNVFDQSPEDELLPAAEAAGVGVIVRVPFDEGSLTGAIRSDTTFPDGDFRNSYFKDDRKDEVWRRVQEVAADATVSIDELASTALRFCLSSPAVSTVIPGMRSVRNVERNVAAASDGPLPAATIDALRRHRWVRDFYR